MFETGTVLVQDVSEHWHHVDQCLQLSINMVTLKNMFMYLYVKNESPQAFDEMEAFFPG